MKLERVDNHRHGGRILKKLWPPIVTPDYTPYLAQIADCDGVCQGFAGSNPLRFMKQYAAAGLKFPVVTGETGGDDALLRSFGDEAIGLVSCCLYTLDLNTESNKRFIAAMVKDFGVEPGQYAAGLYVNGMVIEAALQKTGGKSDDKDELMKALRSVSLTDTPRGPIKFDHFGNVIGIAPSAFLILSRAPALGFELDQCGHAEFIKPFFYGKGCFQFRLESDCYGSC